MDFSRSIYIYVYTRYIYIYIYVRVNITKYNMHTIEYAYNMDLYFHARTLQFATKIVDSLGRTCLTYCTRLLYCLQNQTNNRACVRHCFLCKNEQVQIIVTLLKACKSNVKLNCPISMYNFIATCIRIWITTIISVGRFSVLYINDISFRTGLENKREIVNSWVKSFACSHALSDISARISRV